MEERNISEMYKRRFMPMLESRKKIWEVLCSDFFQKLIPADSRVLDLASGYGEFINNIKAASKFALDLNPDSKKYLSEEVRFFPSGSTEIPLKDSSVDVVFVSNFLEHITKEDIVKTVKEIERVLRKGGTVIVMGPNIKHTYDVYWSYFDHITPLDDDSISEILEVNGFAVTRKIPRFLPYSFRSALPKSPLLVRTYLRIPVLWRFFGKQMLVCAKKL